MSDGQIFDRTSDVLVKRGGGFVDELAAHLDMLSSLATVDEKAKEIHLWGGQSKRLRAPYRIDFARCRTHEAMLAWISHLLGKSWVDRATIRMFILRAMEINGMETLQWQRPREPDDDLPI